MRTRRDGHHQHQYRRHMTSNPLTMSLVAASLLLGSVISAPERENEKPALPGPGGGDPHPGYVLNIIADLGTILKQRQKDLRYVSTESTTEDSEKRGIDFGLGRGYSGSQAARHMLGLQQASFAGGPGKKKKRGGKTENRREVSSVIIAVPVQEE